MHERCQVSLLSLTTIEEILERSLISVLVNRKVGMILRDLPATAESLVGSFRVFWVGPYF